MRWLLWTPSSVDHRPLEHFKALALFLQCIRGTSDCVLARLVMPSSRARAVAGQDGVPTHYFRAATVIQGESGSIAAEERAPENAARRTFLAR